MFEKNDYIMIIALCESYCDDNEKYQKYADRLHRRAEEAFAWDWKPIKRLSYQDKRFLANLYDESMDEDAKMFIEKYVLTDKK